MIIADSVRQYRKIGMANPDGSMTFDWIFFAIVVIPMVFAAWELLKTNKGIAASKRR